jgi:hypothetical protein
MTTLARFRFVALFWATIFVQSKAVRNLRIASPLQALTIWDAPIKDEPIKTRRGRFLKRFRAGLEAETAARRTIAERRSQRLQADVTSNDWAAKAASADARMRHKEARYVENAYDEAMRQLDELESKENAIKRKKDINKYQFVGVVNSASAPDKAPITWYARKKPVESNWSVRLIHVNRDAIIKDLFSRAKVDIFARYDNTGERDKETNQPIVLSRYTVRERSWKYVQITFCLIYGSQAHLPTFQGQLPCCLALSLTSPSRRSYQESLELFSCSFLH